MEERVSISFGPQSSTDGILIPAGLLRTLSNPIYQFNPRATTTDDDERDVEKQEPNQPFEALFATKDGLKTRASIGGHGTAYRPVLPSRFDSQESEPQSPKAGPIATRQVTQTPTARFLETKPQHIRGRSRSLNVATLSGRNVIRGSVQLVRVPTAPEVDETQRLKRSSTKLSRRETISSAVRRELRRERTNRSARSGRSGRLSALSDVSPLALATPPAAYFGSQARTLSLDEPEDNASLFDVLLSPSSLERHSTQRSTGATSIGFITAEPLGRLQSIESGIELPFVADPEPDPQLSLIRKLSIAVGTTVGGLVPLARKDSLWITYENAKERQKQLQRSAFVQISFQYAVYLLLLLFVYFVLVGRPLWGGTIWYIYVLFGHHLSFVGGSAIFIGLAAFYAFGPLFVLFETPARTLDMTHPVTPKASTDRFPSAPFIRPTSNALIPEVDLEKQTLSFAEAAQVKAQQYARSQTALLIPCYKSAKILPDTLEWALKVFSASNIFVLANGNSVTPLDDTEAVCDQFGVNHVWIPVGSKIVAQYVGCYVARRFPYCLLIDDDCLLPAEFPIVIDRLQSNPRTGKPSKTKCLGYTITSIGANRSKGTWCQQAQDLEYKLSGLQRQFAGTIGSATFPHGAIVLWETEFLIKTFKEHPGFSVSEDWFFGHVARILGSRITMCSSVFVETETPSSVFISGGGARGGFGEMTVFNQRFKRWNFFFVNGMYYNLKYILCNWRLGFREIGAKIFVFQEVYETLLYLITPIVLPISFLVRPTYTSYLFAATFGLYLLNAVIFNELHLRLVNRQVNRWMLIFYYMPFKFALTIVNVASCWWSLWQYAKYFAKRHPRIIEDEKAVGAVLKLETGNTDYVT